MLYFYMCTLELCYKNLSLSLPHPTRPGFKGEVCYITALTIATAMDLACRQALGCLLTQYRATFDIGTLRLLPCDY
jgi:hypothetical protein